MKVLKFLVTLLSCVTLIALVGLLLTAVAGWVTPDDGPHADTLDGLGAVCAAVVTASAFAASIVGYVAWFVHSGRDQTAPAPVERTVTADVAARTFRFRHYRFCAVLSWAFAGLFALPLLALPVLAVSGPECCWDKWPVLVGGAAVLALLAWVLWNLGRRYANARLVVDEDGVEVRSVYSTGRFGWGELTAFRREEVDVGALKTQWFFRLVAGERVMTVEPWVECPDEFAALVERASGLELMVLPLNAVEADFRKPTAFPRRWKQKVG